MSKTDFWIKISQMTLNEAEMAKLANEQGPSN